jgi:alpha-galactosidase/6-phospho-beta-glucosidase family protein
MGKRIAIVGGGSSTFVPQLMRFFVASQPLAGSTIVLMDVDAARLAVMESLCRQMVSLLKADLTVEATLDRRRALDGADFVVAAISVGGMDAWERDIEIPARYGLVMPTADSVGPGGTMRAFRHIPVLTAMCRDLDEVSPDAWVFNYTNPATSNVIAMRMASKVRSFGLCTGTIAPLARSSMAAALGVAEADVLTPALVGGLNHCAGFLSLRLSDGRDALPLLAARSKRRLVEWAYETFGVIAYPWSHWVEFFPGLLRYESPYAGRAQGMRTVWGTDVHDMDYERQRAGKWARLVDDLAAGKQELSLSVLPEDESIEVVGLMEDILGNRNNVHAINLPNGGAISNLPPEAVVEVSSLVGGHGITPLAVGPLPEPWAELLRQHATAQRLTAEAAITGDRKTALKAMLADPATAAFLTPGQTEELLAEMLRAHARYLPQFR